MKAWLAGKLVWWLYKDFGVRRPTDTEKLLAYHQVFLVPGFQEILAAQLNGFIKQVALRSQGNSEIQFYRGAIFTLQLLLKNMRNFHVEFEREKKKIKM